MGVLGCDLRSGGHVEQPAKVNRKAQMKRQDWYTVLTLLVLANAALFDAARGWGLGLMLAAILIVVLVDGFGVKL